MFRRWIVFTVLALPAAFQASIAGGLGDLFKQVKDSVVVIETTEKGSDLKTPK